MRRFALLPLALSVATLLVLGCDDSQPMEPSLNAESGAVAAKGSASRLAAPSNAVATSASQTRITLGWQDNSSDETGFEIHRLTTGGNSPFTAWATVGANTVVFHNDDVFPQTEYCYRIRAVRVTAGKATYSAISNTACATTQLMAPIAPSQLTASAASESRIDLTWQDNSVNETSFRIFRSGNGPTGNFFLLFTAGTDTESYSDQGLQPGSTYCYRVDAVRAIPAGDGGTSFWYSEFSATSCATTLLPSAPPAAGYIVGAKPSSSIAVELEVSWTLASTAPLFRIERSTSGGAPWEQIGTGTREGTYWNQPVQSEQPVCYRIVAYNAAGDAAPSAPHCTTPPAAPQLIAMTEFGDSLEFTWSDNSAVEDGYQVWAVIGDGSPDNAGWTEYEMVAALLGPNTTSWRTSKVASTPYQSVTYYVVATKDGGRSNPVFLASW